MEPDNALRNLYGEMAMSSPTDLEISIADTVMNLPRSYGNVSFENAKIKILDGLVVLQFELLVPHFAQNAPTSSKASHHCI
jgi:hypothetical protein